MDRKTALRDWCNGKTHFFSLLCNCAVPGLQEKIPRISVREFGLTRDRKILFLWESKNSCFSKGKTPADRSTDFSGSAFNLDLRGAAPGFALGFGVRATGHALHEGISCSTRQARPTIPSEILLKSGTAAEEEEN